MWLMTRTSYKWKLLYVGYDLKPKTENWESKSEELNIFITVAVNRVTEVNFEMIIYLAQFNIYIPANTVTIFIVSSLFISDDRLSIPLTSELSANLISRKGNRHTVRPLNRCTTQTRYMICRLLLATDAKQRRTPIISLSHKFLLFK